MKQKKLSLSHWLFSLRPGNGAAENQILDEQTFNRMLCLERKRSHRTGTPFVLFVADIRGVERGRTDAVMAICEAIRSESRDTDLCGWYRAPNAIGVLFTALQEPDRDTVKAAISDKMTRALTRIMRPEELSRIRMSFHFFPETAESKDSFQMESDIKLYPDLLNAGIAKSANNALKRSMDIAGSLFLLCFFSPLLMLAALVIKTSSKGPILFKQDRIGKFGKKFKCYKFRTMYANCDHEIHRQYVQKLIQESGDSRKVYKIVNDPRITPIGTILRKTSLDEFPQFINVLLGDMSLVGPRPPIPYELSCYQSWHRRRVTEIKPGITGLWQVYGRSRTSFDEMVRLDIRYIEKQSLWLDIKVLLRTPWAVISCLGAY